MQGQFARRLHVPERRWRLHGCRQLSFPGAEASGGSSRDSEAELPGDATDDGDPGPEDGIGEGHPGSPAALPARYDGPRVHAGAAGERTGDGRIVVRDADERRGGKTVISELATTVLQYD